MRESQIKRNILVALAERGVLAWNNPTGVAIPLRSKRPVRYGIPGAPDILGILPGGRFLGVETKSARGRQSEAQRKWQRNIERLGGLYLLVRSTEELARMLD